MTRTCTLDGCHDKHLAHGYCRKHYKRWRKHGDPNVGARIRAQPQPVSTPRPTRPRGLDMAEVVAYFLERAVPNGDCLERHESRNVWGYPLVGFEGKLRLLSRLVLEVKLGRPIKPCHCALHSCDNPACINPEHLREGTSQENHDDMVAKGRGAWQKAA